MTIPLKILVTGSNGFVGRILIKKLVNLEYQIIDSIENKKIDVTNFGELDKLESVDVVIHLGGKTGIEKSKKFPREFYLVNTLGTMNLLEFCRIKKITKFIYISSYVYGEPQFLPITEEHIINPHSPYNLSKYLGELICKSYSDIYGMNVIILRPFCLFGPKQSQEFFIAKLLNNFVKGESIGVINSRNKRDYLYVEDLVDVIIKCISYDCKFEVFNVGTGISYSFFDIKNQLESLTHKSLSFHESERSPNDIREILADISKIRKKLNWQPNTDLRTGLKEILTSEYSIFIDG